MKIYKSKVWEFKDTCVLKWNVRLKKTAGKRVQMTVSWEVQLKVGLMCLIIKGLEA